MLSSLMFVLTFACGAIYECACVFWVHYSEREQAIRASLWSCIAASVTVIGIESFIHNWIFAVAYVLGFGMGTYFAIKLKNRLIHD